MSDGKYRKFASLAALSASSMTLRNVVLASPAGDGDVLKVKGVLKTVSGSTVLCLEYACTEGRVRQENIALGQVEEKILLLSESFKRGEINDAGGSASLMVSKKGKVNLSVRGSIGSGKPCEISGEKEKNYILDGSEDFLIHLGVSDKSGRVHDKKQAKFRQINRFLEHVGDMMKHLPKDGVLRVADLCCGKSYLSFAVCYYLTRVLHREIIIDCVDLKESVMDFCRDIAEKCGFSEMTFTAGDVSRYSPDTAPDLVISLHACDTATDIVLERAAVLGASAVLATPCCHRSLSRALDCRELGFIARNSVLKSKFCDAATDALRILRLEAYGYSADAVELIDPEDTPKNVLIRAYRPDGIVYKKKAAAKLSEYKNAYRYLCGKEAPPLSFENAE